MVKDKNMFAEYLIELQNYPILSKTEQLRYFKKYKKGDKEARNP